MGHTTKTQAQFSFKYEGKAEETQTTSIYLW